MLSSGAKLPALPSRRRGPQTDFRVCLLPAWRELLRVTAQPLEFKGFCCALRVFNKTTSSFVFGLSVLVMAHAALVLNLLRQAVQERTIGAGLSMPEISLMRSAA